MDQEEITATAERLKELLARYAAQNDTAAELQRVLTPFISDALAGRLTRPVDWGDIPGARTFQETDARELPGLEQAYAHFKIAITAGEPPALRMFRERS